MSTGKTISTADAVRHLIVCDTQFTWAGVTNLTLEQMMDLQARGWVVEGDDNEEFQLTVAGEAVVAMALQHGAPKALADVQPGGAVRMEQEPRDHRWDDVGERCLDCGDKDWMGGACSGPRSPEITSPWSPIGMAPSDGEQHIRGLWVTSRVDGKPDTREWRQFIGLVNDDGAFVDPEYGETFGWEADEYDAWMPVAAAPGAALSAQPSPAGQDALAALQQDYDKLLAAFDRQAEAAEQVAGQALQQEDRIEELEEALAARQPVELQFMYRHPDGRTHTVSAGADDVAREMPEFLSQALCAKLCQCQPVGETNVTDCCCDEDAEQFELIASPSALAWVVADGQGERWRMWGSFGPEWTSDRDQALHFARRSDAEAFANDDEDAWLIQPVGMPAQAVDLGQFRDVVADWRDRCCQAADKNTIVNMAKADRLLALIDSKGVQP